MNLPAFNDPVDCEGVDEGQRYFLADDGRVGMHAYCCRCDWKGKPTFLSHNRARTKTLRDLEKHGNTCAV